jgi:hypothetical protein
MSKKLTNPRDPDNSQFPYRYLLRWAWPDHIESLIRRLVWIWLYEPEIEKAEDGASESETFSLSDLVALKCVWLIAIHPESPGAMLQILAEQKFVAILERVAENPNTWTSTLRQLAKHPASKVRLATAQNPNIASDVLFDLSMDESPDVRYSIAEGSQGDVQLLQHLADDENPYVAARAKKTLARLFTTAESAKMPFRKPATTANQPRKDKLKSRAES